MDTFGAPVAKRPIKKLTRYTSLLEYITSEISAIVDGVERIRYAAVKGSRFALQDLATKQDYVEYDIYIPVDTLAVSLLSGPADGSTEETYYLEDDPLTGKSLIQGKTYMQTGKQFPVTIVYGDQKFFRIYGLPVTRTEMKLFSL